MAAEDIGFTIRTAGSGAEVTLGNGDKVHIKGHSHVSMDAGKKNLQDAHSTRGGFARSGPD